MDTAALVLHNLRPLPGAPGRQRRERLGLGAVSAARDGQGRRRPASSGTGSAGRSTTGPEIFKRHVSVAPFDDDDLRGLIDLLGADRVLFGSDYPHPEGVVASTAPRARRRRAAEDRPRQHREASGL
ncbi:MAG: amidohydrolase family protein [Myxococcota bacterium]